MIISLAGVTAGCGQQPVPGQPSAHQTAATRCASPDSPTASTLTIDNADNGTVVCLRVGGHVLVLLHSTHGHRWTAIHSSSTALTPQANGKLALRVGLTGAFFKVARVGTARIVSTLPECAPGTPRHCGATMVFHVTVISSRQ